MGLGQTIITTFFLVLLTIAAVNANKLIVDKDSNYYQQEAYRQASGLANSLINEILSKKFDRTLFYIIPVNDTNYIDIYHKTLFEQPSNLGPGPTKGPLVPLPDVKTSSSNYKSIKYYTDVDDYNGYIRNVNTASLTGFTLFVKVTYVDENNPDNYVYVDNQQKYLKRIDIKIINPYYLKKGDKTDTLKFSALKAYTY
jgi:hypothetical protein